MPVASTGLDGDIMLADDDGITGMNAVGGGGSVVMIVFRGDGEVVGGQGRRKIGVPAGAEAPEGSALNVNCGAAAMRADGFSSSAV
jgi:hypothetical protein